MRLLLLISLLFFKLFAPIAGKHDELVQVPVIKGNRTFELQNLIEIEAAQPADKIFYAVSGTDKTGAKMKFQKYRGPFKIHSTTTITAYAQRKNKKSAEITAHYVKKPNFWTIDVKSKAHPQYTAGGNISLIDGIKGNENWRKGDWVGFQGQNFEAVINLQKITQIKEISVNFLQDSRSWIILPAKIEYYLSSDDKDYFLIATQETTHDPKDENVIVRNFKTEILPTDAKFLKIKAKNIGKLPAWHQGAGNDAYLFVDEIEIR